MRRLFFFAWAAMAALLGCDAPSIVETDAGLDAGPPPTCADPATRWAFPSPRWQGSGALVVPEGDVAGDAVRSMGWDAELGAIGAWPRRPTLVVPLDREASGTDATRAHLAVREGDAWREIDASFALSIVGGDHLAAQPRDPFPAGVREVLIAFEPGAAGEARLLGVCDALDAYAAAAAEWPGDQAVELAMRLSIADSTAPLARLRERLDSSPALTVRSSEAVELTALGEDAPPAEMVQHFSPRIVRGQLELPDYRAPEGPMVIDADGAPTAQGATAPAFVVVLPSTGTAPYPTVLYQHGGGGSPLDVLDFGGPLAEAGFAFVAIDLPEHGLRGPAGGGSELDFLDFDSPQTTRENFRQAVADHLAVLSGFDALNAAVSSELAIDGALDRTRTFYMGMSLGAVSGSMTTSVARGLVASALFVGGAGYPELMRHGFFELAAARIVGGAEPRPTLMLAVVETIGDAADPLAYARAAEDRSVRPTPMLFLQAIDDPLISAQASDQWARAFGASLARPIHHSADGLAEVDLPASDTFAWPGATERSTRVLVHNPMSEVSAIERHGALILTDYARAMVTHCFVSARDDGSCEIVDTGFASR